MSADAWTNETATDITIRRADQVERAGWRYPFNPHPKQALASSYMVDEILVGGAAGPGKDVCIRERVLTRTGWTTQGNLRTGDQVLAPDGTWTAITAAYPVEHNPCYAITFSTGETITAGEGHLWTVLVNGRPRTVDTNTLHAALQHGPVTLPPTIYNPHITALHSTPTPTVPTRCIAVDHPSRLYLVGRTLIPTHNTDWMLAELVNLSLAIPHVKTLLLRNTYGELQEEIIPRLEERIPTWVGKYSSKLRSYVFYNGARLRLGYLEREKHQQKYIGAEYAAIGFDELTLLPWNSYQFLASRARATGHVATMLTKLGLRPRRLATSNPGGPYHTPVKKHFVDPAPPNTIYQDPDTGLTRVYVPATVDDNPSMPPQYRRLLESLPTEKRKALLEGSWDILEGARFSAWNAARHVITPTQLPPDLLSGERVIAVDYGFADPFAAVWMVKLGSGLIVVYRELYSTELTPQQQAEMILNHTTEAEWEDGISIVMDPAMWGRRDASAPKTGNPNIPPVSSPAHTYQTVLGRVPIRANNDRRTGWAMIDEKLRVHDDGWPRLVVYDWCRDLIRTLPALERGKLKPDDVNQNPKQEDHLCHPAGALVTMRRGEVPIESIRPGDEALTRAGYRPVVAWAMTSEKGVVGEVPVEGGRTIRATANHPYWVDGRGWTRADHLCPGDVVRYRMTAWQPDALSTSPTEAVSTTGTPTHTDAVTASTTGSPRAAGTSTAPSTRTITAPSHPVTTSTTSTATLPTTTPPTSLPSPQPTTPETTAINGSQTTTTAARTPNSSTKSVTWPPSGTDQTKAAPGTGNTPWTPGRNEGLRPASATIAGLNTRPATGEAPHGSAPTVASQPRAERPGWTTSPVRAGGAVPRSGSTSTTRLAGVPVHVAGSWQPMSVEPVYTMTVEEHHEFWADGFLASNSDALRYGAMHLAARTPSAGDGDGVVRGSEMLTRGLLTRRW